MTIQALDLGPREYAALAPRYRAARRALQRRALGRLRAAGAQREAVVAGTVALAGVSALMLVFIAVGAPAWLSALVAVATFVPILLAARRRPRTVVVERHHPRAA